MSQKEESRIAPGFWPSKGGVHFPLAETGHGPHGAGGSQCGLLSGGGASERLLALELRDRPSAGRRGQEPGQAECQLSKPGKWRDPSVPPRQVLALPFWNSPSLPGPPEPCAVPAPGQGEDACSHQPLLQPRPPATRVQLHPAPGTPPTWSPEACRRCLPEPPPSCPPWHPLLAPLFSPARGLRSGYSSSVQPPPMPGTPHQSSPPDACPQGSSRGSASVAHAPSSPAAPPQPGRAH